MTVDRLTIALPKGRLFDQSVAALTAAGLECGPAAETSRKLVFASHGDETRFVTVRPADVPTYVEHGAADIGITGKDVLLEGRHDVCELLDLGFGRCRMVLAAPRDRAASRAERGQRILRVATKFPVIAASYFAGRGERVEIVRLNGAAEIAPAVGLAEMIVDIVDTGRTLREHDLVIVEEILVTTARLIANRASLHLKSQRIEALTSALRKAVASREAVEGGTRACES